MQLKQQRKRYIENQEETEFSSSETLWNFRRGNFSQESKILPDEVFPSEVLNIPDSHDYSKYFITDAEINISEDDTKITLTSQMLSIIKFTPVYIQLVDLSTIIDLM